MRNRNYVLTAALALGLLLSACGGNDGAKSRGGSQAKGVNEVLESGQQAAESQKAESSQTGASQETVDITAASRVVEESSEASVDLKGADGTDIDLTKLSATMVFSEVYNIMVNPDSCMGKTIRMKGACGDLSRRNQGLGLLFLYRAGRDRLLRAGHRVQACGQLPLPGRLPAGGLGNHRARRFDVYKEGEYKYAVLKDAVLENVNTQNEGETTAP